MVYTVINHRTGCFIITLPFMEIVLAGKYALHSSQRKKENLLNCRVWMKILFWMKSWIKELYIARCRESFVCWWLYRLSSSVQGASDYLYTRPAESESFSIFHLLILFEGLFFCESDIASWHNTHSNSSSKHITPLFSVEIERNW